MAQVASKSAGADYRAYVGPAENYDRTAALQFSLLSALGLREHHEVLDVGCGSLRVGKLLIPYLLPDRYCGIEPNRWLVEAGLEHELGHDIVGVKRPAFDYNADFDCGRFARRFDVVIAQSIFSHATAEQIRSCVSSVAANLADTGIFLATFVLGDTDYQGSDWVYPGCVRYTQASIERVAQANQLAITGLAWPHPYGQSWFAFCRPGEMTRLIETLGGAEFAMQRLIESKAVLEERYTRLARHPYVRLGMAVQGFVGKARSLPRLRSLTARSH